MIFDVDGGDGATLTSVTFEKAKERVYNFEVAGTHSYYVGEQGRLTHNAKKNINVSDLGGVMYGNNGKAFLLPKYVDVCETVGPPFQLAGKPGKDSYSGLETAMELAFILGRMIP